MDIGWPEILIIAVVILVLFGSRKMPDAARSLGRSLRILKTEVKGLHDDDDADTSSTGRASTPAELPPGQTAGQSAASETTTGQTSTAPAAGERTDSR
jgi:sec-independent protein translocase protein TatA